MYFLVVRQINRNRLGARIAVPGVENNVIGIQIGIRARRFSLVGIGNWQAALQLRQECGKFREAIAPLHVFDQHVGFERRTISEQAILVTFNCTDNQLHRIGLDVHP